MNVSRLGIDFYIPNRKFQLKPHSSPWFTPSCAAAIAHRNHYFHQYHRNSTPENTKLFFDSRNHFKDVSSNHTETAHCLLHISLLPIISEIVESFGLFSDLQYGFYAFWSTADILTVLSECIYNSLDAGG